MMSSRILAAVALVSCALSAGAQTYTLIRATLTYHMSHPIHQVDATSTDVKGKGTCGNGKCDFLIAAPVKSFVSGDSNRDLHMIQTVRGAEFPMVVVRTTVANPTPDGTFYADLEVQFAGQTAHYSHVSFEKSTSGNQVHITGTVPATCSDFKIIPPSFLTVAIKNEIPVRVDMSWQQQ